jgi:hypothetical protein
MALRVRTRGEEMRILMFHQGNISDIWDELHPESLTKFCGQAEESKEPPDVSDAFIRSPRRTLLKWQPLMFSGLATNTWALIFSCYRCIRKSLFLLKPKIHHRRYKSPNPAPINFNPARSLQSTSPKSILLLFSHLLLTFPETGRQR